MENGEEKSISLQILFVLERKLRPQDQIQG